MSRKPAASPARSRKDYTQTLSPPLGMQLLRARDAVMARFRPRLRALGLTDQQGRILRVLADGASVEMLELARRSCIHPASLSRIIPTMDSKGLVRRKRGAADGRRVSVSITPRGFQLFKVIAQESEQVYKALADELGAECMRDLHRVLDALIANRKGGGDWEE